MTNDIELKGFRSIKEGVVRDMDLLGTDDACPVVEVWRGGEPIVLVMAPQVDRDLGLEAAHTAIRGMSADRIVMMMDAHVTKSLTNPSTGQPWQQGEMQKACDEEGACSLGLITDCLLIQDVSRNGDHVIYTLPYHVNKEAKEVHWQTDEDETLDNRTSEAEFSGLVPDSIRAFFEQPSLIEEYVADADASTLPDGFLTDPMARALQDAASISRLLKMRFGCIITGGDDEWVGLVQDSLLRFIQGASL